VRLPEAALTSYHSRISEISDVRPVLFVSTLRLQVLAVQTKPEVSRHILKTGENVFQKQETQFDNDFPISENANDTNMTSPFFFMLKVL
jgi:hypothetical protein